MPRGGKGVGGGDLDLRMFFEGDVWMGLRECLIDTRNDALVYRHLIS